ncbi:MAG: hypothetical protein KTR31_00620 [Myxococcales bacterium]|nr:hypothetical protein [Myxococcales bacterium]
MGRSVKAQAQEIRLAMQRMRSSEALTADAVNAFVDMVRRHFAAEEGPGGWLYEADRDTPHLADRLDAFREDHAGMLAMADALLVGPINADAVRALVDRLEEHERHEGELMARVLYEEFGGRG